MQPEREHEIVDQPRRRKRVLQLNDCHRGEPFDLEAYWDQARFEKFNRACWRGYREMKRFLDENGLANRMRDTTATDPALKHAA